MEDIVKVLQENPIILSINDHESLEMAIESTSKVVMTMYGDVVNIIEIIDQLRAAGKIVFVNIDLIYGFSPKTSVIDFIEKFTSAEIIVSQKAILLKYAKERGFITMHRFFVVDSHAYRGIGRQLKISHPDLVNIAPAWSQPVEWAIQQYGVKVVASGLITTEKTVNDNLKAGAIAVATTNKEVWKLADKVNRK